MRWHLYFLIVVVAAGALDARSLHVPWPDTSIAGFDRLFAIAVALFVVLVGMGAVDRNTSQLRDWRAWTALAVASYGLLHVFLPAVQ